MKKFNGIWFYGLSGSGKTYASKILKLKKKLDTCGWGCSQKISEF